MFILYHTIFLQERTDKLDATANRNDKRPPPNVRLSRAALEREIIEFEELARQMLGRMDIMLVSVSAVSNERDPAKRLEV